MVHIYILARAQPRFLEVNDEGSKDRVMWVAGVHKEILMGDNVRGSFCFLLKNRARQSQY